MRGTFHFRDLAITSLVCRPILPLLLILQHIQIRSITRLTNKMSLHCLTHRTSRLMPMCTVTIFTISGNLEYFREIMPDFFLLHIECAESFDSRCIDNISIPIYGEHFRKSSRMHTFVVIGRYLTGFYFGSR